MKADMFVAFGCSTIKSKDTGVTTDSCPFSSLVVGTAVAFSFMSMGKEGYLFNPGAIAVKDFVSSLIGHVGGTMAEVTVVSITPASKNIENVLSNTHVDISPDIMCEFAAEKEGNGGGGDNGVGVVCDGLNVSALITRWTPDDVKIGA